MARNKHPEETVARILDAATRLFMEKGYEHTSVQDIVDSLDGLTKGAVYHHFKGKEDIFDAAMNRVLAPGIARLEEIRDDPSLTGLEKMRAMAQNSVHGTESELYRRSAPCMDPVENARMLGLEFKSTLEISAHRFMQPVIEQGVADGTIQTEYPKELAEVLALVGDLWAAPVFYPAKDAAEQWRRMEFLSLLAQRMGVDVEFKPWADPSEWETFYGKGEEPDGGLPERA